jgi:hypothetical protein
MANKPFSKLEWALIVAILVLGFYVAFCADPADLVGGL